MSTSTIKKKMFTVLDYPLCTNQSVNASWLPQTTFAVKAGDIFQWSLKSNASSGQLTRNVRGSVGGDYYNDGPNHASFNNGGLFAIMNCQRDEILTISSYTNASATITSAVTIFREL